MNVYVSHCLAAEDRPLLEGLIRAGEDFGATVAAGPRPWPSAQAIAPEAAQGLDAADFVLFWLTAGGPSLQCVNLEAGYLRNTKPRLPSMIFTDRGSEPSGVLQYRPHVSFNADDARITVHKAWDMLHHEYQGGLQDSSGVKGLVLWLTGALLMRQARRRELGPESDRREAALRDAARALMRERP